MMEEILIKKHVRNGHIEYPAKCIPVEVFSTKMRDNDNDLIEWNEVEAYKNDEFAVSKVESLEIPERYIRGIITHKGEEYVFTVRVSLMQTMTKIDMSMLLELAINEIKRGIN
jgi:hypothetical protein